MSLLFLFNPGTGTIAIDALIDTSVNVILTYDETVDARTVISQQVAGAFDARSSITTLLNDRADTKAVISSLAARYHDTRAALAALWNIGHDVSAVVSQVKLARYDVRSLLATVWEKQHDTRAEAAWLVANAADMVATVANSVRNDVDSMACLVTSYDELHDTLSDIQSRIIRTITLSAIRLLVPETTITMNSLGITLRLAHADSVVAVYVPDVQTKLHRPGIEVTTDD